MTKISQSQLRREAAEIALWQTPSPKPDAATMSNLSQFDSASNDQAVGNSAVGDGSSLPDLGPLSSFGSWESVASTILHKAATLSSFDPGSPNFDPVAWNDFLRKFSAIPCFLNFQYDTRGVSISPLSLEKSLDAVSDLTQSFVTQQNFSGIVTTIKKMGTLALQNKGQMEKDSHQQVGILSRHASRLYLAAVRTEVQMQYKSGKGYEQLQQTIDIYRGVGVLDFDSCMRNAELLLAWDRQDVDQWVDWTASAPLAPNDCPAWNN